jgi:transposase-like protein
MAGRPTKLTPEIIEKVCAAIYAGNYAKIAAQLSGISESTYYAWMAEAEKEDCDPIFLEFSESVERAEAAAEVEAVALIRQSAKNGNAKDAQWLLERKHGERWGRNDKLRQEITGADGAPLEVSIEMARAAVLTFLQEGAEDESVVEGYSPEFSDSEATGVVTEPT